MAIEQNKNVKQFNRRLNCVTLCVIIRKYEHENGGETETHRKYVGDDNSQQLTLAID